MENETNAPFGQSPQQWGAEQQQTYASPLGMENGYRQATESQQVSLEYAGFWIRFIANSIDGAIIMIAVALIILLLISQPLLAILAWFLIDLWVNSPRLASEVLY